MCIMKLFGKKINKKPSKWHNTPCEYNGIKFDSHKERDRYIFLKSLQDKGVISELKCQPRFTICPEVYEEREVTYETKKLKVQKTVVKKVKIANARYYYADFQYVFNGNTIVEDVKSDPKNLTDLYLTKKDLVRYFYRIEVIEIYNPTSWNHVNSGKKPR